MTIIKPLLVVAALYFALNNVIAESQHSSAWILPLTLSDNNTEVRYQYHAMGNHNAGRSVGINGRVWLETPDHRSVRAQITIPTPSLASLTADSIPLLGHLLQNASLPPVLVSIDKITNLCRPQDVQPGRPCNAIMVGSARFGSLNRTLSIPVRIERKLDVFVVRGEGNLDMDAASQAIPAGRVIESASFSFKIQLPT